MPEGGLNIRLRDTILGQEARLHDYKRDAMLAFVRANKLNKYITSGGRKPKIGIITVGKSYLDVRQALDELGIDEVRCNDLGIRLYKIACPWPISQRDLKEFAEGLELIIVVEEKRSLIEVQVREELYGTANQPVCIGKKDEQGNWLFPVKGALDPNDVAICIGERILQRIGPNEQIAGARRAPEGGAAHPGAKRRTSRCARPISARAARTIHRPWCRRACAPMPASAATTWRSGWTARRSASPRWAARAPTGSARRRSPSAPHVFQNLGDGTYNHSGYMAIRAAIAAGVNITYKILFNDAVAMTGGQANDGGLTVPQIARQVAAEGAKRVVVVTDEPWKYPKNEDWPRGLTIHHRDDLIAVQTELADDPGRHGADLRPDLRRREAPAPQARTLPRSRQARDHQRAGLRGLRRLRREVELRLGAAAGDRMGPQAHHRPVELQQGLLLREGLLPVVRDRRGRASSSRAPARLASATHVPCEGRCRSRSCRRSGRPTTSSSPASAAPASSPSAASSAWRRISRARASASSTWPGSRRRAGRSTATCASPTGRRTSTPSASRRAAPISCSAATSWWPATRRCSPPSSTATTDDGRSTLAEFLPGDFTRNADFSLPTERLKRAIIADAGRDKTHFVDATRVATALFGNSVGANIFLVGYAYQLGAIPLSAAVDRAGDRAQRRSGRDEQGGVPLGPPRRRRSRRGRGADRARAGGGERRAQAFAIARRDRSRAASPSSPPIRTPPMRRATAAGSSKAKAAEAARSARQERAGRGGRALSVQADGLQGRVRGGAALYRRRIRQAGAQRGRRRASAPAFASCAAAPRAHGQGDRRAEEDDLRPVDLPAVRAAREVQVPARHRVRSVRLFGGAQDRAPADCATTRRCSRRCWPSSRRDNHHVAVGLAAIPEKIRGFGHVKMRHLAAAKADEAALLDQFRAGPAPLLRAAE